MTSNITIILGHPATTSYCRALAENYQAGAEKAGHHVTLLALSDMTFDPILHDGYHGDQTLEPDLQRAQEVINAANHIVIIYPLWMGMMPALLKGFFERCFTRGFAYDESKSPLSGRLLKGKSAHIIVTMGMPAWFFRWFYGAHSTKSLIRNLLHFCGIKPVRTTYFGMVEAVSDAKRKEWLSKIEALGRQAG